MKNHHKQSLTLILICIVSSVLSSFLTTIMIFSNQPSVENNAIQTVTISEVIPEAKVNLNTATIAQLKTLPHIGDVTAQRIIDHRPFADVWELADIEGVGAKTLKDIIELVEV